MLIEALILSTLSAQAPPEMRLMRNPTIFGDTVVFNYAGDLWTADRKGGTARRLTSHAGNESFARFSPDGKWIAFSGSYDGNPDVYVMPADGGEPKRLTFEPGPDIVGGWTADGKVAYVTDATTPGTFTLALKFVSPQGGMPIETKLSEVFDFSFSPDGTKVAFNRNSSHNFNWRRYRGGTQGRIGFSDTKASFYEEIGGGRENSWHPMWVGEWVYYISDRNQGTRNLYRYHTSSKRIEQLTKYDDADIKWPSTDGKRIVFERDGYLYTYDLATTDVERLHPQVKSDAVAARPQMRELGGMVSNLSVSPSGARLAVEARGELFSVPAKNGDTRMFSAGSGSKEYAPAWSPDGQTIAFLSDKDGNVKLYTMPQMGGDWNEVKTDPSHRLTNFRWSPDGKSLLCLAEDPEGFHTLHLLNPVTGAGRFLEVANLPVVAGLFGLERADPGVHRMPRREDATRLVHRRRVRLRGRGQGPHFLLQVPQAGAVPPGLQLGGLHRQRHHLVAELGVRHGSLAQVLLPLRLPLAKVFAATGEAISSVIKKPPMLAKGQLHFFQWQARADSSKAERELGFRKTPLEDGLRRTLDSMGLLEAG